MHRSNCCVRKTVCCNVCECRPVERIVCRRECRCVCRRVREMKCEPVRRCTTEVRCGRHEHHDCNESNECECNSHEHSNCECSD